MPAPTPHALVPPTARRAPAGWRLLRPAVWVAAVVSAGAWSLAGGARSTDWAVVALLVVAANVADLLAVRVRTGMRVSTAHFAVPLAVLLVSPLGGVVAALTCVAVRLVAHRRDWNGFDVAVALAASGVASLVARSLHGAGHDVGWGAALLVVTAYVATRQGLNYTWALESRAAGRAVPAVSLGVARLTATSAVVFAFAGALAQQRSDLHDVVGALLLAVPFAATQQLVRSFGREHVLHRSLEDANLSLTESLVGALDARDPYSAGHSVAVAVYARDVAAELGLPDDDVRRIYLAGLLHDVGKIAVRDAVLQKPAALTDAEFDEIRQHPVVGEQILAPAEHFRAILPAVRHHHERIDGRGYPDGLDGDAIPLDARIVAVADAYNAMTTERPYRDAMAPALAQRILRQNEGSQHDLACVSALVTVLARGGADYSTAVGPEFGTGAGLHALVHGAPGDARQAPHAA